MAKNKKKNEDALAEMMRQNQENSSGMNMGAGTVPDSFRMVPQKNGSSAYDTLVQLNQQVPRYLEEADRLLSSLFETMSSIDQNAANIARGFYQQAEAIADTTGKIDKDALAAAITLECVGDAIKGVGQFINWFKKNKALNEIKATLRSEAKIKLPIIRRHLGNLSAIVDGYQDAYDNFNGSAEDGYTLFQNLRLAQYTFDLNIYLRDTYQAVMEGNFYNGEMPSIYSVNRQYIDNFINPKKGFTEAEVFQNYVEAMEPFLTSIADKTAMDEAPTLDEYVFARDSTMMYTAIHDYYPLSRDNDLADLRSDKDPDDLILVSEGFYDDFARLFYEGSEHQNSLLGSALYGNEALDMIAQHYPQFWGIRRDYNSRRRLYTINNFLLGILFFLIAFGYWDWKWYWSLATGIGGMILGYWAAPFKTLKSIYHLKETCVNRTIQAVSLSNSGYKETLNLAKIETEHTKSILAALIWGVIGQFVIPVPVIGFIIGAVFGFMGSGDAEDYGGRPIDYQQIKTGSRWKSIMVCILLSLSTLYVLYTLFF